MDFLCFNHKYPLTCLIIKREFKKLWGKVRSEDITVKCPDSGCGMEITYSIKIKEYKNASRLRKVCR